MSTASTLQEALEMLAEGWQPFAGGTDIMVCLAAGKLQPKRFVNIWELDELRGIHTTSSHITIGSLTTMSQLINNPIIKTEFPNLYQAAKVTGAIAIQNRATIGGNIVNASPAADTPPALLTYDAVVELRSLNKVRNVAYATFHTGYKTMLLAPGELLTAITLPRQPKSSNTFHYYRKIGTRKAQAITKVGLSGFAKAEKQHPLTLRIAMSSVAPTPCRCYHTEQLLVQRYTDTQDDTGLINAIENSLRHDISPIDDHRSTKAYRQRVACNLVYDFWSRLCRADFDHC